MIKRKPLAQRYRSVMDVACLSPFSSSSKKQMAIVRMNNSAMLLSLLLGDGDGSTKLSEPNF